MNNNCKPIYPSTSHGSTSTPAIRSNRLLCFSSIVVTVNSNHEGRALNPEAQPI